MRFIRAIERRLVSLFVRTVKVVMNYDLVAVIAIISLVISFVSLGVALLSAWKVIAKGIVRSAVAS